MAQQVQKEKQGIDFDININKEGVEDTLTEIKEATSMLPNITIRNNDNVYVTINLWNRESED